MSDERTMTGAAGGGGELIAGRYELWRKLGEGGMGEVFEAFDHKLHRRMALKRPPREAWLDLRARKGLLDEARLQASLGHPHIVSVQDVIDEGAGRPVWVVMGYVEGRSLKDVVLSRGRLEPAEAAGVALQMAQALGAAHEAGVVHRDVKPSNIMVDRAGWVYVLDFGVARLVQQTMVTLTGQQTSGTPLYMAPEQHIGGRAAKDRRVDVFAFGCVLYEMLAGEAPFAEAADPLLAKERRGYEAPGDAVAGLPPGLCELIDRCLEPDPAKRIADFGEVEKALRAAVPDARVPDRPAPQSESVVPSAELRRSLAGGAGVLGGGPSAPVTPAAAGLAPDAPASATRTRTVTLSTASLARGAMLFLVVAVLGGGGFFGWRWMDRRARAREASVAAAAAEVRGLAERGEFDAARKRLADARSALGRHADLEALSAALSQSEEQYQAAQARAEALTAEGGALYDQGRYEEARARADEALKGFPASAQARGLKDRAEKAIGQRELRKPLEYAMTLLRDRRENEGLEKLDEIARTTPELKAEALSQKAGYLLGRGEVGKAEDVYRELAIFSAGDAWTQRLGEQVFKDYAERASKLSEAGKEPEVRALWRAFRAGNSTNPHQPEVKELLARSYQREFEKLLSSASERARGGRFDDARQTLEAARALAPLAKQTDDLEPVADAGGRAAKVLSEIAAAEDDYDWTQAARAGAGEQDAEKGGRAALAAAEGYLAKWPRGRHGEEAKKGIEDAAARLFGALIARSGAEKDRGAFEPAGGTLDEAEALLARVGKDYGVQPVADGAERIRAARDAVSAASAAAAALAASLRQAGERLDAAAAAIQAVRRLPGAEAAYIAAFLREADKNVAEGRALLERKLPAEAEAKAREASVVAGRMRDLAQEAATYLAARAVWRGYEIAEAERLADAGRFDAAARVVTSFRFPGVKVSDAQVQYAAKEGLPVARELDLGGGVTMKLVLIPPGEFMMGSPEGESGRHGDEGPQHRVRITKPFYMGIHEVTNAQFRRFRSDHSSKGYEGNTLNDDNQPVVCVSWNDATEFCKWLSERAGAQVRLPTEAEWEYACRAGTTAIRWWGAGEADAGQYANVADRTAKRKWSNWTIFETDDGYAVASPVGSFKPNGFGLYDTLGNVWEWCQDWYGENYYRDSPKDDPNGPQYGEWRVLRGGSWRFNPRVCRSAYRGRDEPTSVNDGIGFRVAVSRDSK